MQARPQLRVFVAGGDYDDLFPCPVTEEIAKRSLGAFPTRTETHCYAGGHMMYLDEGVAQSLASDIRDFIRGGPQFVN